MVKIAISSDNHLDVNRVDIDKILIQQAEYLNNMNVEYYLFAGDMFNNFNKTSQFFQRLKTGFKGKILYIAGNHDLLSNVSYEYSYVFNDGMYLNNRWIDIPNTDWRIIGLNGWYDYTFSAYYPYQDEIIKWKKTFWIDSSIVQPVSDYQRTDRELKRLDKLLNLALKNHKRVIFLTHFVPDYSLLWKNPHNFSNKKQVKIYEMVNAFLGSQRMSELLSRYNNVKYVFYGHTHGIHSQKIINGTRFIHSAVGVHRKRRSEWQQDSFMKQWIYKLNLINIS